MVFLLFSIACSATIALIFKRSESKNRNRYALLTVNYLVAITVSLTLIMQEGWPFSGFDLWKIWPEMWAALGETELANEESLAWAVTVGLGAGFFFFAAFVYYQIAIRHHGMSIARAFQKMGAMLPMVLSLVLWRELPTSLQGVGIALAVASLTMVNMPRGDAGKALKPALLLVFLFGGMATFSNKVFQKYGMQDHKAVFLMVTFSTAFVFSLITLIIQKKPFGKKDLLWGVAVGAPNLFTSYFLIMALDSLPAAVVYPAFAAGAIVVVALVDLLVFKEQLSRVEKIAILLTIVALVLINL